MQYLALEALEQRKTAAPLVSRFAFPQLHVPELNRTYQAGLPFNPRTTLYTAAHPHDFRGQNNIYLSPDPTVAAGYLPRQANRELFQVNIPKEFQHFVRYAPHGYGDALDRLAGSPLNARNYTRPDRAEQNAAATFLAPHTMTRLDQSRFDSRAYETVLPADIMMKHFSPVKLPFQAGSRGKAEFPQSLAPPEAG